MLATARGLRPESETICPVFVLRSNWTVRVRREGKRGDGGVERRMQKGEKQDEGCGWRLLRADRGGKEVSKQCERAAAADGWIDAGTEG